MRVQYAADMARQRQVDEEMKKEIAIIKSRNQASSASYNQEIANADEAVRALDAKANKTYQEKKALEELIIQKEKLVEIQKQIEEAQ